VRRSVASYDLLDHGSARCSSGWRCSPEPFSLDAAEAVCAGGGIAPTDILDLVGRLSAKSLLQVEDKGRERESP
jgi:hypothetical protein